MTEQKIIRHDDKLLAVIDNFNNFEPGLSFYGSKLDFIQVGCFRYDKNKILKDHRHLIRPRMISKSQEIIIVFKGSCEVRTFSDSHFKKQLVNTNILKQGDFYISYNGGVGFTVLEDDTIMLEIKNGPYDVENDDEERELL